MGELIFDLKLLVCSYFTLEEILIIFKDTPNLRDKIISRFTLPNINTVSADGRLQVLKYLYQNKKEPITDETLHFAVEHGHLEIVKYIIHEIKIKDLVGEILHALQRGYLEISKFLTDELMKYVIDL